MYLYKYIYRARERERGLMGAPDGGAGASCRPRRPRMSSAPAAAASPRLRRSPVSCCEKERATTPSPTSGRLHILPTLPQ